MTEKAATLWPGLISTDDATALLERLGVDVTPQRIETICQSIQGAFDSLAFDSFAKHAKGWESIRDLRRAAKLLPKLRHLLTGTEGIASVALARGIWHILDHLHADYDEKEAFVSPPGSEKRSKEIRDAIYGLILLENAVRAALLAIDRDPEVVAELLQPAASADWGIKRGVRPRTPDFDIFIGTLGRIYEDITGKRPGASERAAGPSVGRSVEGPFVRFVLEISTLAASCVDPHGSLRQDPEWRKVFEPTPDEIREAWRRFSKNYRLDRRL